GVEPFLTCDAPAVRGAAVASLIRHGGLEGILTAADDLTAMLQSDEEPVRYAAGHVLREIAIRSFLAPVQSLLSDKSPRVQNAAIAAAGAMRAPELVAALIYKLERRETARSAALALANYGDAVTDVLQRVLN